MAGIVPTEEAFQRARDAALDLVEVSPNADPPVCKILDYGKFKYEQKKRDHEAKRKQRGGDFKEIRFRPKTERHDLSIKMAQVRKFLMQGDRVQITMVFRGREMQHFSMADRVLTELVKEFEDIAKVERSTTREGRRAFVSLMPKPGLKKDSQRTKAATGDAQQPGKPKSGRQKATEAPAAPQPADGASPSA
jgi:translation initiation factor IF-3